MKKISIIVAVAANWAIGKNNDLLWHIPEDFKWFKKHTTGNPVVMGRKTWESLPLRPLPNRTNVVISDIPGDHIQGCTVVSSVSEAVEIMDSKLENFIIGGGSVYRQFLPLAQTLYLTRVHGTYDADIFFPEVSMDEWDLVFEEDHPQDPDKTLPGFTFQILKRKDREEG